MSTVHTRNTDLSHLHPTFRARVQRVLQGLHAEGLPFQVFEAFRSPERQQWLHEQGRVRPGSIVTNARPWESYHQFGLAVDFVLFVDGRWNWDDAGDRAAWWTRLHQIGRSEGLEPLSFEKPHLQLANLKTRDLREGKFPPDGDQSWVDHLEGMAVAWSGHPAAPPLDAVVPGRPPLAEESPLSLASAPAPGTSSWHNANGGVRWAYDERGVYLKDVHNGREPLRTPGEPVTCRAIWNAFGKHIVDAASMHGVAPELIMMTIATETAFARRDGFTGQRTFRWEPNALVSDLGEPRRGDYSAGPMQPLASTARWIIRQRGLAYDPLVVAPPFSQQPPAPALHPLYDPATNIDIGTAAIRQRWAMCGDDPILVAAVYNAGGLYSTSSNQWRLRSHGDHLDRAARWYGDACAVLRDLR